MGTSIRLWALVLLLLTAPLHANERSRADAETDAMTTEVALAFGMGDFELLMRLHERYSQPDQVLGGVPRLEAMRIGIMENFVTPSKNADAFHTQMQALTLAWVRQHPRSGLAHALYAHALISHARAIRASGDAGTLAPQARAEFERLTGLAQRHLADHAAVAQTSTLTHSSLLTLARLGKWSEGQVWAVLEDGIRRQPQDVGLYGEGFMAVLATWGGDAAVVERYIRRVVERTKSDEGLAMYARLYNVATALLFEERLFEVSHARWEDLDRGLRDLRRIYPSMPLNSLNRHAYFACLARDRAVLLELLADIGDAPIASTWGPDGNRTFENCRRWAQSP